jgi:hypothetical protein
VELFGLCAGDFNEITMNIEKRGRLPCLERQMSLFREAIDECELLDLGYTCVPFTWCNNRDAMATIWARLDRAMASVDSVNKFQGAQVKHLYGDSSDHCPLLIYYNTKILVPIKIPFRFEQMWTHDVGCFETIKKAWDHPTLETGMLRLLQKINQCRSQLGRWSKTQFGSVRRELKDKTEKLRAAKIISMQGGDHH